MPIHAPNRLEVQSGQRQLWHNVFRLPWDIMIGIDYVQGATLALHAGKVDGLASGQGEVVLDDTDSTRDEKDLGATGELLFLVSTSVSDTTDVMVVGVTSDGDCETKIVTLTGTTPVAILNKATDDKWLNVNRFVNVGNDAFAGDVFCSTKITAGVPANSDKIQAKMEIGTEYASNPMIMCGNNEVLVFVGIDLTTAQRDEMSIFISRRPSTIRPWIKVFKVFAFEAFLPYRFVVPIVITEGQKICFTGKSTGANTDSTWQSSYYSLERDAAIGPGEAIASSGIAALFDS